jgi:hypothetical protein
MRYSISVEMKTPPDLRQRASISVVESNWEIRQQCDPRPFCTNPTNFGNWHPSVQRNPIGDSVQSHTKLDSRQVLCRELTLCTVWSKGSERPSSSNRPGDRVDFIPKGLAPVEHWQGSIRALMYGLSGLRLESLVTERYSPYSRLALERVSTMRVGGEAEGGLLS